MFKTYDFSVDLSNIDRNAYINEAARLIDDLKPHHGETVRTFTQDKASFGETPEVCKITGNDFIEKKRNIPHIFTQLSEDYDFYQIRFPVNFIKKSVWAFNKLEVIIDLLADPDNPQRYPKAFQVLPDKKFLYSLQSSSSIAVNIDDNFQFSADPRVEIHDLLTLAQVSAKSESNAGMVLGPYKYSMKRARVDHSDIGNQWIFWILDGIEFVQDSTPDLVIITQIAKNTKKLNIRAQLQAYCDFSLLPEDLQTVVGSLPDDIKSFFIKGCPALDIKEYRLTL